MTKKPKKDLFPQTKELIRIALNDGMTQIEIGRICRVGQPQVSKWKSGNLATRQQMKPLLERYGEKLRRVSFKLYQTRGMPDEPARYVRVEGKLILREKFRQLQRQNGPTALRISVHHQANERFALVIEVTNAPYPEPGRRASVEPLISDRHAAWFLDGPVKDAVKVFEIEKLRNWSRDIGCSGLAQKFPAVSQLPFLITEALMNHGFKLDDIEVVKAPV